MIHQKGAFDMKRKRTQKYGRLHKTYSMELKYTHCFKSGEAEVKKTAKLCCEEMNLNHMIQFQKDLDKIHRQIKRLLSKDINDSFELYFFVSILEEVPEYLDENNYKSNFRSICFDAWEYKGYGYDEGISEGFYLSPDQRYTDEKRAIYISMLKEDGKLSEQLAGQEWAVEG